MGRLTPGYGRPLRAAESGPDLVTLSGAESHRVRWPAPTTGRRGPPLASLGANPSVDGGLAERGGKGKGRVVFGEQQGRPGERHISSTYHQSDTVCSSKQSLLAAPNRPVPPSPLLASPSGAASVGVCADRPDRQRTSLDGHYVWEGEMRRPIKCQRETHQRRDARGRPRGGARLLAPPQCVDRRKRRGMALAAPPLEGGLWNGSSHRAPRS